MTLMIPRTHPLNMNQAFTPLINQRDLTVVLDLGTDVAEAPIAKGDLRKNLENILGNAQRKSAPQLSLFPLRIMMA